MRLRNCLHGAGSAGSAVVSRMRPRNLCFGLLAVAALLLVAVAVARVLGFIQLFGKFGDHLGIRITQEAIELAHNRTDPDPRPQLVPKIFHQIFHNWKDPGNETLPEDWAAMRKTCTDLHSDWEHKLWNEGNSREFIANEYPAFLNTYDGYRYPVQRIDALRYFLLMHFGGIYMDLDNGCQADFTPLLYYPLFIPDGGLGTLSNNIIGSRPHHPFWSLVTTELTAYDYNYLLPYATIHYASGQWFLTSVWEDYHHRLPPPGGLPREARLYHVMADRRAGADPWVFFTQGRGGTWDHWDNRLFFYFGKVWWVAVPALVVLPPLVWACVCFCRQRRRRSGTYYSTVPAKDEES